MPAALPPPPTSRKARATYDSLIEASRKVLRKTGGLSPEAVAAEADVSPATFYTYFASKDIALAAAFDAILDEMHQRLQRSLGIEQLLEEGLQSVVQRTVRMVVRGFTHDALVFRVAISRLPDSKVVREVYRRREAEILESLVRFIRLGAAARQIRSGDTDAMAKAMLVTIQGYQNPLLQQRGAGPVVDELAGMLLALLAPERPV